MPEAMVGVGLDRAASLSELQRETVELMTASRVRKDPDILICLLSSRRRGGMIPFTGQGTLPLRGRFGHINVKTVFSSLYMKRQISFPLWMGLSWRAGREHATDGDGSIWIKTRFSNLVSSVFRLSQPHGFYSSDGR
jgi:hypothetical protein